MAQPGEVCSFWSDHGGKQKFHLCISMQGCFLYLNSPKTKSYPGDFVISNRDVPFLPPTADGNSIISCNVLLRKSDDDLLSEGADCLGTVPLKVMRQLVTFLEGTPVMAEDDRSDALDGLYDWVGV
ncbi:hypothetical protein FBY58_1860 [Zymomonas mobilis]|uniref:Uncharacterized protein n=1 Tax=Zymomonas mobilis TaxID=542 RepID=A0A542VUC9_ZYMMB|nr:hypothetical protein FBY58_1860 [Zymomonas mobilis]